jgi:hypothetical protein
MPGGLLQLVAYGQSNIILTGDPKTTFFKSSYKKYTSFGMQRFRIDFEGLRNLSFDSKTEMEFKIPRYADLLWDTYIVVNLPDIWSPIFYRNDVSGNYVPYEFNWINDIGFAMIDKITIHSGGSTLAEYSGEWMMNAIRRDEGSKRVLLGNMTGSDNEIERLVNPSKFNNGKYPNAIYNVNNDPTLNSDIKEIEPSIRGRKLYIPLMAWFTYSTKVALPLVAMQYQEVSIKIEFNSVRDLFTILDVEQNNPTIGEPVRLNLNRIAPNTADVNHQLWKFLQPPLGLPTSEIQNTSLYLNKRNDWNTDIHLIGTYIFLGNEERNTIAKCNHSYLIKQQYEWDYLNVTGSRRVDIPSKDMVASYMWRFRRSDVKERNQWFNYSNYKWENEQPGKPQLLNIANGTTYSSFTDNPFGLYSSGPRENGNIKNIMIDLAILYGQEYRENILPAGVYAYIEKWWRTTGIAKYGLYCYNFCTNSSRLTYQPTGAQNANKVKYITFEFNTIQPPKNDDPNSNNVDVLCDDNGEIIGIRKDVHRLNKYNFDLRIFEERYNMIEITSGRIGLLQAR